MDGLKQHLPIIGLGAAALAIAGYLLFSQKAT